MSSGRDPDGHIDIADYAVLGDGRTAALVGRDGSIDWACLPRFDSPAVFCRLLDGRRGGFFQVVPASPWSSVRRYLPGTNVLETTFATGTGRVRLTDAMALDGPTQIVRSLLGLEGEVEFEVELTATFDYARRSPDYAAREDGAICASSEGDSLVVWSEPRLQPELSTTGARGRFRVRAGERAAVVLLYGSDRAEGGALEVAERTIEEAVRQWRAWSERIAYAGPWRDLVLRSALVLKLLVHQPTGALVAAPTTSLPEELGGTRNWDYRFTWLRDAALVLDAFMALGLHAEAMSFWDWISALCIECCAELRLMYTLDGREVPAEEHLDHLAGYRCSRPVRVGNGAANQRQLDVYGYVLDAAWVCQDRMAEPHPELRGILSFLADEAARRWREPDQGLWEFRTPPRHFLHSKLMCWVALDRAVRLAQRGWLQHDARRWAGARDEIRAAILSAGFDPSGGSFTQTLGGTELDASALAIPLVGFLPADDPRVVATVSRIQRELGADGLIARYRTGDDGLPGGEGTFVICTFWMVQVLAMLGREQEAHALFERATSHSNDLGLLAEEIDPATGQLLGNFPQAFSHLALIQATLRLGEGRRTGE